MATERKSIAQLPGFDTSPDVYETPDIADDTTASTARTSQVPSEASDTSEEEDEDSYGVSRRRLYPERARSRFGESSRGVDTRGADLSDRVDGRRKGYKVRRDYGADEDDETLEAKIARLRREVEEAKAEAEAARQERSALEGQDEDKDDDEEELDEIGKLLARDFPTAPPLPSKQRKGHRRAGSRYHDAPTTAPPPDPSDSSTLTGPQTLTQISSFDSRLAALEQALGLSTLDAVTEPATTTPILPTLKLLDNQIETLTTASSLGSLELISSRIAKLKQEAQQLNQLQQSMYNASASSAKSSRPGSSSSSKGGDTDEAGETPSFLAPEDMKRLESLYTLLPTLQSLSPVVPMLLTRLRSMHNLYSTAQDASDDLTELESRQTQMDKEIKMWREGLHDIEGAVEEHNQANGRNGNYVKAWVEDLEKRVKALGR